MIAAVLTYHVSACCAVALFGYLSWRRNRSELNASATKAIDAIRAMSYQSPLTAKTHRLTILRYDRPTDPLAEADWSVLSGGSP